nr:signal peptidase I [Plantibacter sp. VKM Ac-2880]
MTRKRRSRRTRQVGAHVASKRSDAAPAQDEERGTEAAADRLSQETERWTPARIGGVLLRVASWTVVVVTVVLLVAFVAVPRVTGSTPYTILTGSMRPEMPPGTMVVVRPVDPATIEVGDVVTYQLRSGEPEVVTHRIIETVVTQEGLEFRTQGDANDASDPELVRAVQVRGEAWYWAPFLGYLTSGVTSDARTLGARVIGIGLIAFALFSGVRTMVRARRS